MNRNYYNTLLLLGFLLVAPSMLYAQKKTDKKVLSEKVEVTKSYIPKIGKASKRDITPTPEDNVQVVVPKLKYSISYKPEKYPFVINELEMPKYKLGTDEELYNGYADFSIGAPLSTRANLFYTTTFQRTTIAGISLNHKGYWGKIDGRSGTESYNDLSLFFEYQKENLKTKIWGTQRYDIFSRYGQIPNLESAATDKTSQHYLKSTLNVEIGTTFEDLNRFNTNFYASVNVVSDKYSFNESIYQAGILLSKGFSKINSRLEGRVEYLSSIPSSNFILFQIYGEELIKRPEDNPTSENIGISPSAILSLSPHYLFNYKGLDIDLGVNVSLDFNGNKNNYKQGVSTILPKALLSYSFFSGALKPYAKIDGNYILNNYFTLSEMNPYVLQGLTAPNTTIRQYMLGISGNVKSNFTYDLHIGLRQSRDLLLFLNMGSGAIFSAKNGDFDNTEYGLEMGYILNSLFTFNLDMKYIDYNNRGALTSNVAYGYAPFVANLTVNYFPTKKLRFSVGGELQSERTFASIIDNKLVENSVGSVFDLRLEAEYKVTNRLGLSLRGENLLNQKLYPFNYYQGIGLNVMVGASYKF